MPNRLTNCEFKVLSGQTWSDRHGECLCGLCAGTGKGCVKAERVGHSRHEF